MFLLKKLLLSFITFPGLIIIVLILLSIALYLKRQKSFALITIVTAFILYFFSISVVTDSLEKMIEVENFDIGSYENCDCIVLLGGGITEKVSDLTGNESLNQYSNSRLLNALRLYKKYNLPIIVSGGIINGEVAEAQVYKRVLMELDVPEKLIIIEDKSRDTEENVENIKNLIKNNNFRNCALVTSAFHMRRASYLFTLHEIDFIPLSVNLSGCSKKISIYQILPGSGSLNTSSLIIKELFGLMYYKIML